MSLVHTLPVIAPNILVLSLQVVQNLYTVPDDVMTSIAIDLSLDVYVLYFSAFSLNAYGHIMGIWVYGYMGISLPD
jgi:hypothetical protein